MKSTFQTILLVIFGVLALLAVLIFSGVINVGKKTVEEQASGRITIWGMLPKDKVQTLMDGFSRVHKTITVTYIQVDAETFDQTLAEKISIGQGPDLLFLPQNMILRQSAKINKITYEEFSEKAFKDTYIQEGDLLLANDGIIGLPLIVDPMIMYFNRGFFESAGFANPPKTWDELVSVVPSLTKKSGADNTLISSSAIALGTYSNINHAKDIISLLLLQAGNPIVVRSINNSFMSVLANGDQQKKINTGEEVLSFYTQFADPSKETYTWNKSLPSSSDAFISEQSAMYFGYASELPTISKKNQNLDFYVAKMPQVKDTKSQMTFGRMTSIVLVKTSKNFQTAKYVQEQMSNQEFVSALVSVLNENYPIAPARRDLLTVAPKSLLGGTLYSSALISRGWLDPGEAKSHPIFKTMIDDIIRGAVSIGQSLSDASAKINILFQ